MSEPDQNPSRPPKYRLFARSSLPAWGLLLVVLVAGGVVAERMSRGAWIETNIMALLPPLARDPGSEAALRAISSRLERRVFLSVGHEDAAKAKAAAARLVKGLAALPGTAAVEGKLDESRLTAWADLYAPFRHQLPSPRLRALLARNQGEAWAREALARVYSPFAAVGSAELEEDPFFLLRAFLLHAGSEAPGVQVEEGWLSRKDGQGLTHLLVTLELGFNPYTVRDAKAWEGQFNALALELKAGFPGLALNRLGTIFFAGAGIRRGETEVSTIGLGSALGVVALVLAVFHSLVPLGLVLLSLACAIVVALAVTMIVMGPVHIFTLVFGASLIGVSVDYAFHFLCEHHGESGDAPPGGVLRKIMPALLMSLVTSVMAYLALFMAPFPGMRQIALFSVSGLLVAFATVVWWYPALSRRRAAGTRPTGAGSRRGVREARLFERWLAGTRWMLGARWALPVLMGLLVAVPALGLRVDDDVRQLQSLPGELVAEEKIVSRWMGSMSGTRILLVRGDTAEEMLLRLEAMLPALERVGEQGGFEGYRSVSPWIPSMEKQRADHMAVRERLYRPWFPLLAESLGLPPPVEAKLLAAPFRPLEPGAWLASPASAGWRELWLDLPPHGVFSVVVFQGLSDPAAVAAVAKASEGVAYSSAADEISVVFKTYRDRIQWLILGAYALIWVLLSLRYGLGGAWRIMLPPLGGAAAGLTLLALAGRPLNVISLFAVVLVLGLGIDYALFMGESRGQVRATLQAVAMSALTTLLSFGLLALSSTQAIANFGLVAFGGITMAFLLAPIAHGVAGGKKVQP